jgi:FAD:protein FMN transferase
MEKRLDQLQLNRRSFLRMSGLLGLGAAASSGIWLAAAEAVKFNKHTYKISETKMAIGSFVSMTLIHSSRDAAEKAMSLAFEEVSRLEGLLNRFNRTSAVGHLNKEEKLKDIPPDLQNVIAASQQYYTLTNGAFDITVAPIVDYYQEKSAKDRPLTPSDPEIRTLLKRVDARKIHMDQHSIAFQGEGMGITLDGIAAGYIVDRAAAILAKHKIENFLINGSGEIRTMGKTEKGKPWRIAIQDPFKRGNGPDQIEMTSGAVSTSGNYEIYFDREKMFHHIVNPQTGLSPHKSVSVSVVADTTVMADALSTGVYVMEPDRGIRFIDTLPHCAALVVTPEGQVIKSRAWKSAVV